ncbi:MAG: 2-succinyl-6-hydroxy-2,4-cyclohexadiene-1-carboxylate synthase [Alphaproteobacteria bacterium MarineAlpha4_Bin2]|nr:MAG: 2-succinyl-6-hydroxy-2,4-cyclohexadiene-1-carboxylate synthase [Alphaproteobacteria bacterium MarineAlpha4_Bin2]
MIKSDPQSVLETLLVRCREKWTPCGDGEMVWRVWGAEDAARTVILLHGGFGAWNHWVRNIPTLETRYRTIVPDLPGCGDSSEAPKPYDAESLAAILSDGLDIVVPHEKRFDLVSFSFGGVLSGLLARLQARRIQALTLVGSPILGLTGSGPANELVEVPPGLPPEESAPLYRHNLQKLMVCDPKAADDLALLIQTENMSKARLRSRGIARTSILAESLRDLPCPLRCIFGDKDVTLDPDLPGIRTFVEQIQPGAPFHIISDAGHWVQFEAADHVNELLPTLIDQSTR